MEWSDEEWSEREACAERFPPGLALIAVVLYQWTHKYGGQLVSESQKVDFLYFGGSKSVQTQGVRSPVHELYGKELMFTYYCSTQIILPYKVVSRIPRTSY